MVRLDHISLPVRDWKTSRDWWREHLGFAVEFEIPERNTVAMVDEAGLTVFLHNSAEMAPCAATFTIQVDDVEAKCRELTAHGVALVHGPRKVMWGYGAELLDPNGYRLQLWDEASMTKKGGG